MLSSSPTVQKLNKPIPNRAGRAKPAPVLERPGSTPCSTPHRERRRRSEQLLRLPLLRIDEVPEIVPIVLAMVIRFWLVRICPCLGAGVPNSSYPSNNIWRPITSSRLLDGRIVQRQANQLTSFAQMRIRGDVFATPRVTNRLRCIKKWILVTDITSISEFL
jgi:hypothetical protein